MTGAGVLIFECIQSQSRALLLVPMYNAGEVTNTGLLFLFVFLSYMSTTKIAAH